MRGMNKNLRRRGVVGLMAAAIMVALALFGPVYAAEAGGEDSSNLLVVWSSGDKEVAGKLALPYPMVTKSKGVWAKVRVLIWGPSAKLLAEEADLQGLVKKMQGDGIEFLACKWCADQYKVSEKLQGMGITVDYMDGMLSDMLKSDDWKVLTL